MRRAAPKRSSEPAYVHHGSAGASRDDRRRLRAKPVDERRQVRDRRDDVIGVRLEIGPCGFPQRSRKDRDGDGAGRPRGVKVVQRIADESDRSRGEAAVPRESEDHARRRLSTEPGIVAGDESPRSLRLLATAAGSFIGARLLSPKVWNRSSISPNRSLSAGRPRTSAQSGPYSAEEPATRGDVGLNRRSLSMYSLIDTSALNFRSSPALRTRMTSYAAGPQVASKSMSVPSLSKSMPLRVIARLYPVPPPPSWPARPAQAQDDGAVEEAAGPPRMAA
jgi:hypothetical protein